MTDRDKLKKLLTEFGVGFEERSNDNTPYDPYRNVGDSLIICKEGENKIGGYFTFFTEFVFHEDGSFKQMGAWE
ncbi:MAG TPA: hypothetical protein ENG78_07715 [Acidiferrobacteraceae bacterium]|nr:hypothetical protein [Acidiferrobacteraceae bacterium]HEX20688.1 hypothetical protein [Acidiferrobacteraceae bacterium]